MSAPIPNFLAKDVIAQLSFLVHDVDRLQRLTRFPETEPWWGKTMRYRFDDPMSIYGVTYAAPELDVAFAETLIHEVAYFDNGAWLLPYEDVAQRWIVRYQRSDPTVMLLDLTGVHLKRLGLNNDICSDDDYGFTQRLSRAVHEQLPHVDGIYYISRQLNTQPAVALFERSGVRCDGIRQRLDEHPALPRLLDNFNVKLLKG